MIFLWSILVLCSLGAVLAAGLLIAERFLVNYGPCKVLVNEGEGFVVEGGCSLLEALYADRIFIPSACGGQCTCGYCKVTVPSGGGPVLATELGYLTDDEISDGVRLACQVKVRGDVEVHVREDYLHVEQFRAVVRSAHMLTGDTRELVLELVEPKEMSFNPGQYVQVSIPTRAGSEFRAYSISSTPREAGRIELVVRLIPGGLGSTYLHNVGPGDEILLVGPYGEFEVDDDRTELVCVGGGCGMAPMRSIVRWLYAHKPEHKCWLFYGARTDADLLYHDEFRRLAEEHPNFHFVCAVSEPRRSPRWTGEEGLIHEFVRSHLAPKRRRQAFLCGPEPMIDATIEVLKEKGLHEERIFFDKF